MGRLVRPVEDFLATETASSVVLSIATVIALVWANSPWADVYRGLWATPVGVSFGDRAFEAPVRFVVDELLMTVFFFVVGLEIRREIARGELSEPRRAALPFAAAVGGMLVPAAIFAALNAGRPTIAGWGVPMATDIAFAVGALAILGRRVPPALRVLLLALAVIDDVGAILVIGVFYSSGFAWSGLALAAVGVAAVVGLQRFGVWRPIAYVLPGALIWFGFHEAGVHATLAGVVLGLLTPAVAWTERDSVAPVDALQHALHRVVAFGVMPIFALTNAGVSVASVSFDESAVVLVAGIVLGLVMGKIIGIAGGSLLAVRLGVAALPTGVTPRGLVVVGAAGGIGFTMSLFVADLAFEGTDHDTAKVGVLAASLLACVLAVGLGRLLLPSAGAGGAAETESDAERETIR